MTFRDYLTRIIQRQDLTESQMADMMNTVLTGQATEAQIGAMMASLATKGETFEELAGAAQAMRQNARRIQATGSPVVDTCGTGGDAAHTFNISTASALVAAAAGARVAKHGGRSVSSTCGSADVLEALGVNLSLTPEQVGQCIGQIGIGFMFAPNFHGAMKYAAPVRRELGVRTIFNVLGPLTNPAGADNQVMGVFHQDLVGIQARVLQRLGSRHVLVVHGADGMDEISISDGTYIAELKDSNVSEYTVHPDLFGLTTAPLNMLRVANIGEAQEKLMSVLNNEVGAARDIVQLNAGAAIYVAGLARTLEEGVANADQVISSGAAKSKLDQLIAVSNGFKT